MKRKAHNGGKRLATRERVSNIVFTLKYTSKTPIKIRPVFFGKTRYPADDTAHCGVFLDPPLSVADSGATLDVYYAGKHPIGKGHVTLNVCQTEKGVKVTSLEDKFYYRVLDTHALRLDENGETFSSIEFTLHNTQLVSNDNTPILQVITDIMPWFNAMIPGRVVGQPFYPVDPTVMEALTSVKSQDVPQRTPYWFKLRGIVTGSKGYKLCGYFPGQSKFTAIALKRMRFGTLREDFVCYAYVNSVPYCYTVHLLGLVPYVDRPGWGASPDGLIVNTEMTWDQVPAATRAEYEGTPGIDIKRGALEIKCSQADCNMRDYYYPQIYLEMMSLGAVWTDVVRYSEKRASDGAGTWSTKRECRVYRIYREKEWEDRIVNCILVALKQRDDETREKLYKTRRFTTLRADLRKKAQESTYALLMVSDEAFKSYTQYHSDAQVAKDVAPPEKRLALVDSIQERQLEIVRLYEGEDKPTKQFIGHVIGQVRDLLSMVEEKTQ